MSLGSFLRRAREQRHLTLDEVALRVKIRPDLLADLEDDDVERWPQARVYRHGYLRACAELLGLDPASVLAQFDDQFGDLHPSAFHQKRPPAVRPVPFGWVSRFVLVTSMVAMTGGVASILMMDDGDADVPDIQSRAYSAVASPWIPTVASSLTSQSSPGDEAEGELRILSNPPRAHVTVNGIGRGATPLRVRYLPPGAYTIRVIHPDYRIRETRVTLSPDEPRRTVRVALRNHRPFGATSF